MNYEVKIQKLDVGFTLTVVDKDGDSRVPVKKMALLDTLAIKNALHEIYEIPYEQDLPITYHK